MKRPLLSRFWSILSEPVPQELRSFLDARMRELPAELRTELQVAGRHFTHCGYIMGPSYCSFGCTHCYLPKNANRVPLPTLDEMKSQIDANRRLIGPGGGLQITGGDVVDAYWRAGRAGDLAILLRYANRAGLVPMLMTHGQVLLENPDYLDHLVRYGGLRKLALHIDITQAGRPGFPIQAQKREADLHPLRELFVDLLLGVRRRTGVKFFAAHTVTVCERNLESVADIPRWLMADPRHLEAFRMVSFQTEAAVGRTRELSSPVSAEEVWRQIQEGVGIDLSRENLWFGHPDCSNMTTLMVIYPEGRVVNLIPADTESRKFWAAVLRVFGGIGSRGGNLIESGLTVLSAWARHPSFSLGLLRYIRHRLREERLGPRFLGHLLRGRVRGLNIVMHNFMSRQDLTAPRSEIVEKRLAACAFRGAYRRNGQWEAVPMCEMNANFREAQYARLIPSSSLRSRTPAETARPAVNRAAHPELAGAGRKHDLSSISGEAPRA